MDQDNKFSCYLEAMMKCVHQKCSVLTVSNFEVQKEEEQEEEEGSLTRKPYEWSSLLFADAKKQKKDGKKRERSQKD